jgi:hypothetical protein
LENLRKKINMKNKTQINLTKSTILNIFSTKNTMEKKDDDYYEDKKENKNKKISNAIEEENDNLNNSGDFADLLIKINDLDYNGYN